MNNKDLSKLCKKRVMIVAIGVIYLFLSYQLKVVRGYNQQYTEFGMSDFEIVVGASIVIAFIVADLYKRYKLKRIIDSQLKKRGRK